MNSRIFQGQTLFFAFILGALFFSCVLPFVVLIEKILTPGGTFSFDSFHGLLSSSITQQAILNTLIFSASVTLLTLLIGVPLGWLLTRTNLPFPRKLRTLFCLPYVFPPYVSAIAWVVLANPSTGLLNNVLGTSVLNIYSFPGLVWVEGIFLYAFVLLAVVSALEQMDGSLEEAARLSGASKLRVFFDITLPLIKPALLSGGLLVFLSSAASFGVPALIGSPGRIFLITTQIYTLQRMGTESGLLQAGALALVLLIFAIGVLTLNALILKRGRYQIVSGKTSRPSLIELEQWKWPIAGLCFFVLLIILIIPFLSILYSALSSVQGQLSLSTLTLDNFHRILFETDETGRAFWNSFAASGIAATLATLLGVGLSYLQWKTRLPGRHWLSAITSLPYATPGTVVALALILTFSGSLFGFIPSLYNTLGILILAYIIKYLSFAVRTTGDGINQIHDSLAEAARISGASWSQTLTTIWIPLLKSSIVASWFLIFMPSFSELTMTILLSGPGMETLGTLIFQLQEYSDEKGGAAAVLSVIVVVIITLLNYLIKKVSKGRYGL